MVNKWEIYFCNLNPAVGSEQQGMRPVLIVSNDSVNHNLSVSTVLPLSSVEGNDKVYPTEVLLSAETTSLPKLSVAMVQQIRTVSHDRLVNKAGKINDEVLQEKVLSAIQNYFEY